MVRTGPLRDPLADERALCEIWFADGLTDDDREWLRPQLELVGQKPPARDIRWITFEWRR